MWHQPGPLYRPSQGARAATPRILIVEDDATLTSFLRHNLEIEGYKVDSTARGDNVGSKSRENPPDLVVLDWMMPGVSGVDMCQQIRLNPETAETPIIILTTPEEEAGRISKLATGIEDCLVKPFSIAEFLARVRSLLRPTEALHPSKLLRIAGIEIDRDRHRVTRDGRDVYLGLTEFRLLEFLIRRPGRVFTRQELLHGVWGKDTCIGERTVDVHIARLRRALKIGKRLDPIRTVRGSGYSLKEERYLNANNDGH